MRVMSSYKVEIRKLHKPLKRTMDICRAAAVYLLPVIDAEWEGLSAIVKAKERFNAAERLIHETKQNRARYPFDREFPKMPSYLRRAVLQHVLGAVSAAHTAGGDLAESGHGSSHYMPVFYRDNMYRREEGRTYLKLYSGSDWVWYEVQLLKTDLDYLRKRWSGTKEKSPVLVRKHKKYYLQFAFEKEVRLTEKEAGQQRICAVDLGINTDAVCSIMTADGTVAARRFVNFPAEKDRLHHVLNRIRKKQRRHGPGSVRGFWAYAKRLNEEIARKTAGGIIAFAKEHDAGVIVFEYLDTKGKKIRGKNRQRLHMWKKQAVQKITEHRAHLMGMRISRVCAWNTSRLACDGSGAVRRDTDNRSLCTFANGKRYHCDLSASYNIGARYFIRELLKPVPETERSALAAKVPGVQRRITCTYADLLALGKVLAGA